MTYGPPTIKSAIVDAKAALAAIDRGADPKVWNRAAQRLGRLKAFNERDFSTLHHYHRCPITRQQIDQDAAERQAKVYAASAAAMQRFWAKQEARI